jgi:C1A family cysteine protease
MYDEIKQYGVARVIPSRAYIYFNERLMEGTVAQDSGASLKAGMQSIKKYGFCQESDFPYLPGQFRTRPPPECYAQGERYRELKYYRVRSQTAAVKAALASGYVVVIGLVAFPELESPAVAATGQLTGPKPGEKPFGGHAVLIVGYTAGSSGPSGPGSQGSFIVRNSWGPDWGDQGYFYMPFDYLDQYVPDAYVVQQITLSGSNGIEEDVRGLYQPAADPGTTGIRDPTTTDCGIRSSGQSGWYQWFCSFFAASG